MSYPGAATLVGLFSPEGSAVYEVAVPAFRIFSVSLMFCGVTIYVATLFTALSNGKIAGLASLPRTFAFLLPLILLLPRWTGVWLAIQLAEGASFVVSVGLLVVVHGMLAGGRPQAAARCGCVTELAAPCPIMRRC